MSIFEQYEKFVRRKNEEKKPDLKEKEKKMNQYMSEIKQENR